MRENMMFVFVLIWISIAVERDCDHRNSIKKNI